MLAGVLPLAVPGYVGAYAMIAASGVAVPIVSEWDPQRRGDLADVGLAASHPLPPPTRG